MRSEYPEFRDWSIAAVKLLQGVLESDDGRAWDLLLANIPLIEQYFARMGLQLVVDESEGLAYLRQFSDETLPAGYDAIPKLFRSTPLSFGQTLLCVLLRETLRRFEEEDTRNERCVIDESELFEQWRGYFPMRNDEVKQLKELKSTLAKLEELGFVRKFGQEPVSWEVRRILKARLTVDELEHLHRQLRTAVENRTSGTPATAHDL